ncbi:MAG: hypothetical protein EVB11_07420 [Winogradskyella sp.]|nr:MAG: hypothetical protein EVB11_07420 [Winogradskyella sp.]
MRKTSRILIIIVFAFIGNNSFGQTDSTQVEKRAQKLDSLKAENGRHGNLVAYLYELEQISGIDNIKHTDSTSGYSLVIPLWWKIRETPNASLFGGTFPAINEVENALLFKAFGKSEYESFKDFKKWVIADYKMGDMPKWSNSHKILLKKELDEFKNIGKSYKVQLMRNGYLYDCCYIIIETSNSYLWIDFTATKETYDLNFAKLKEIIADYKTL